ncbi:hypothetical protein [Streptomyces boninensis]|uniref:hypothetical protein n=1 Tax=Streptomyces boninensis TaxID=2039455 RepID=UPI003B220AFC
MDARARCAPLGPDREQPTQPADRTVLLAELHPDTLPDAQLATADDGAAEAGWPGFFHRAHRLLRGNGDLLLLATRQRRNGGGLTDPLGWLVACARTAGFSYLQHIVVVHGRGEEGRIVAAPPDNMAPELIHSDLLVLDPGESASRAAMPAGGRR